MDPELLGRTVRFQPCLRRQKTEICPAFVLQGVTLAPRPAPQTRHSLWEWLWLSCGETAAVCARVHLPTMHCHVGVSLLYNPPVFLLKDRKKKIQIMILAPISLQGKMASPRPRQTSGADLDLGGPRLLVKAHGHGVASYPEEVGQGHRFPLQPKHNVKHWKGWWSGGWWDLQSKSWSWIKQWVKKRQLDINGLLHCQTEEHACPFLQQADRSAPTTPSPALSNAILTAMTRSSETSPTFLTQK